MRKLQHFLNRKVKFSSIFNQHIYTSRIKFHLWVKLLNFEKYEIWILPLPPFVFNFDLAAKQKIKFAKSS